MNTSTPILPSLSAAVLHLTSLYQPCPLSSPHSHSCSPSSSTSHSPPTPASTSSTPGRPAVRTPRPDQPWTATAHSAVPSFPLPSPLQQPKTDKQTKRGDSAQPPKIHPALAHFPLLLRPSGGRCHGSLYPASSAKEEGRLPSHHPPGRSHPAVGPVMRERHDTIRDRARRDGRHVLRGEGSQDRECETLCRFAPA